MPIKMNVSYLFLSVLSLSHVQTYKLYVTNTFPYLSLFILYMITSPLIFIHKYISMCSLSLPPCHLLSLSFYLNLGCLIADWEWDWESGVFWLEHEPCPVLSSPVLTHKPLFTHWGRGLCSCRYRSYLSVMSCSPGMDHNSEGNAIHGTKRMTHRLTVGKCFFVFWKFVSLLSTRNVKWLTLYWK